MGLCCCCCCCLRKCFVAFISSISPSLIGFGECVNYLCKCKDQITTSNWVCRSFSLNCWHACKKNHSMYRVFKQKSSRDMYLRGMNKMFKNNPTCDQWVCSLIWWPRIVCAPTMTCKNVSCLPKLQVKLSTWLGSGRQRLRLGLEIKTQIPMLPVSCKSHVSYVQIL